jgi:hypothetical protein
MNESKPGIWQYLQIPHKTSESEQEDGKWEFWKLEDPDETRCYFSSVIAAVNIVTWRLKAGIVKPEQTTIARQRLGKHIPAATNTQAKIELSILCNTSVTIKELLGNGVFC